MCSSDTQSDGGGGKREKNLFFSEWEKQPPPQNKGRRWPLHPWSSTFALRFTLWQCKGGRVLPSLKPRWSVMQPIALGSPYPTEYLEEGNADRTGQLKMNVWCWQQQKWLVTKCEH